MSSLINIQVFFDKSYEFNLLRENLTWQKLSTVIQSSIAEAADKEPLSLYYSSDSEIKTLSNQDELSQLLLEDILGLRLYGQSQENMESVHILPLSNEAFKRLSEFVHQHNLKSDLYLSKMVGILAARIVYSPQKNFDDDLTLLENLIRDPHSVSEDEYRKLMKSRKMLWKHGHHHKWHKKMTHHHRKHTSLSDNEKISEFLSHHPSKSPHHRHGRSGFPHHYYHHPRGENLNVTADLAFDDDNSSETENNDHIQDKYVESDASLNSVSDSESENEEGGRCGRRGGRFERHHHQGRFGSGRHHGHHEHDRRHLGGPGIRGPGFHGPKFSGEHGRRHRHGRREEAEFTGFRAMNRYFGHFGHGRKHKGEKLFVFA
ncbi:hypothetical protein K501DRAFT_280284 [Backusella circina FSU 941]|nr:hypothetical protein K501DRAFT_280284 [Backusella circina FSU 941]